MQQAHFTDRLISSPVMESSEVHGRNNDNYKHSMKSINEPSISSRPYGKNSIPNGSIHHSHVPFDRMVSTASSHFTASNSVLKLVLEDEQPKVKTIVLNCRLKTAFCLLLILSLAAIGTLATLYALELNKQAQSKTFVVSTATKISKPRICYHRMEAYDIDGVQNKPEIVEAIEKSTVDILQAFQDKRNGYHAFSLSVNYMGEKIWTMDYGHMDFRNQSSNPPTQDTKYPVASITKVFTVLMLERLVADGVIGSLDDDISKYEDSLYINNPFNSVKVTFRQLACMMSGMNRESPCFPYKEDNYCPYTNEEMFKRINNSYLVLPPDKTPSYSNLGVALLGRILERQLHNNQTYEEWVTQNILQPLDMTNTGFDVFNRSKEFPVSTSKKDKLAKIVDWGWNNPGGGMYSTSEDLGKLGKLFVTNMGSKSILSQKVIKRLLKPEFVWSNGDAQGCPFEILNNDLSEDGNSEMSYLSYSKRGGIFGYMSEFLVLPELKLNINSISARIEGYHGDLMKILRKHFIKAFDHLIRKKESQYNLPPNYESYIGSYQQNTSWPLIVSPCNVTFEDNKLFIHMEWLKVPVVHVRDNILKPLVYFHNLDIYKTCSLLGDGILRENYYFDAPTPNNAKSAGFYIQGISSYGYVRFNRIDA